MADRPYLFLGTPIVQGRSKLAGGGPRFTKPTPEQQAERLQSKFASIAAGFDEMQTDTDDLNPEQVVVFETLNTSVLNLAEAAARIPGMEWLAELDLGELPPEFGFSDPDDPMGAVPCRLYAVMSNQQALNDLLGLWHAWTKVPGKRAQRGFGPFKTLFSLLRDVRRWSTDDRVRETGILQQWREHAEIGASMRFEVEFWFRSDSTTRSSLESQLAASVGSLQGAVLSTAAIPDICYHAALVELPAAAIQKFLQEAESNTYTELLLSEGVMFFRPRAQAAFGIAPFEETEFDLTARVKAQPIPSGTPTVAVFDGFPLASHVSLADRVIVDDPDEFAGFYQKSQMQHGTAMTSIVIHGDLNGTGPVLPNPIYLRPILRPDTFGMNQEVTPPERLLVDFIHRAFLRLFEPTDGHDAVAPAVKIVNLSIGDPDRPFDRSISPLAKLLDWLAWHYRVLIIVSIGNHHAVPIELDDEWDGWDSTALAQGVLRSMRATQIRRRPLSPSEAINCLSAGSSHSDLCGVYEIGDRKNLGDIEGLPSPLGTVAHGFRRSTKPEVLFPGGRLFHRSNPNMPHVLESVPTVRAPGVLAAAPGVAPFELDRVQYSCGTSNAAALATRCAALALDRLTSGNQIIPSPDSGYLAVLLKALVAHGASLGKAHDLISSAFPDADWHLQYRLKQQFFGFGIVDVGRCLSGSDERATALAWGSINHEEGHVYQLPLPPSLASKTELRRLTATLAWISPLNARHQNYRRAQLWIDTDESLASQVVGLDAQAARRGTIEHRVWEGIKAVPFVDGDKLIVTVNCKADAGKLTQPVPYALVVSLEVAVEAQISVYDEVAARIPITVPIQTQA